jgi:hypothetical protein
MKFYNASFEIENYICSSLELKKLRQFLFAQKRNFKDLMTL